MPDIANSVGAGAHNGPSDVVTVQSLLNNAPAGLGGPTTPLSVDGKIGPKTIAAITRFQVAQLGWGDGRVDPGHDTIKALNNPGPVVPIGGVKPQGGGGGTIDTGPEGGGVPIIGDQPGIVGGGAPIPKTFREPIAVLMGVSGNVQVRRGGVFAGADGMPLYENDTITSTDGGTAKVRFLDGNFVLLGPGPSMVVLYPRAPGNGGSPFPNVWVDKGELGRGIRALGGWAEN